MLMPNASQARIRDQVNESRDGQTAISGGSSETDVNAFTSSPIGPSSSAAVTRVTPVAKRPRALRKAAVSNGVGRAIAAVDIAFLSAGPRARRGRRGR